MLLETLVALATLIATRTVWRRYKYDLHKIPSPAVLPLLGHTPEVLITRGDGEVGRFVGRVWKQLGEPTGFKISIAGRTLIFVRDMDCARSVVMSKTKPFARTQAAADYMTPMLGNDLSAKALVKSAHVTPYTKAVRKVYAAGLQSNCLRAAMPKLHGVMDKMIEVIEAKRQEGPVNFQELCMRMTIDAIGVVALGTNLEGLDGSSRVYDLLIDAGHITFSMAANPFRTFLYKQLPFLK